LVEDIVGAGVDYGEVDPAFGEERGGMVVDYETGWSWA
jgi:hypothetical protein